MDVRSPYLVLDSNVSVFLLHETLYLDKLTILNGFTLAREEVGLFTLFP